MASQVSISQNTPPERPHKAKRARHDIHTHGSRRDPTALSEAAEALDNSTTEDPIAIRTNMTEARINQSFASDHGGNSPQESRPSEIALEYAQPPDDLADLGTSPLVIIKIHLLQANNPLASFEQDLFDQISTQPYDCTSVMDRAFEASLGLDDIATQDYGPECRFWEEDQAI